MSSIYLSNQLNPASVGPPSLASATARSNSSAICRGTVTWNLTTATSAFPNCSVVDGSRQGVLGEGPQGSDQTTGAPETRRPFLLISCSLQARRLLFCSIFSMSTL